MSEDGPPLQSGKSIQASTDQAQRIDVWLWRARFFKTRTLSAKTVSAGGFRIDRAGAISRVDKPSVLVRPGDRLSFSGADGAVRIVLIVACGPRRGPAIEATTLYTDLTPPASRDQQVERARFAARAGRPTKKDRRAIDRLHGGREG